MIKRGIRSFRVLSHLGIGIYEQGLLKSYKVPSPKELKSFLDDYVVGQTTGKKVLSVAVYNHYLRVFDKQKRVDMLQQAELLEKQRLEADKSEPIYSASTESQAGYNNLKLQLESQMDPGDQELELSKSNVLVVGPSGSGKTLLASTLARILDVPIAITDCTQLTQAGYIGEDVEVCIERLLVNSNYDVAKAERGIIVLDEVDKLAKPAASIGTKDVSGEGVQQSLLKILEGHKVEVTVKRPVNKKKDAQNNQITAKKEETFVVDTSNILFMLMGAFVGLDKHVVKRIEQLKFPQGKKDSKNNDITKLRFSSSVERIDLGNGKETSALNLVTPTDLVSFGIIPELIGRVPVITALEPLHKSDLYHILKEPKNALLNQYCYVFKQFGVKLCVTEKALLKIANFALEEGTGARGLRGIMERVLLNVNYECPESGIAYVLVDQSTVESLKATEHSLSPHVKARYYSRGERDAFIEDIYKEDPKLGAELDREFHRTPTRLKEGKKIHE
ncbi:LAMI_0F08790g1_1 [Lachancea mirantina]|uniref:LAMI_0F08790g1_1 n=1 Tax=Lachancea mirantina TaxID=1230905 RepID=A0A1G4K0Q3_9SACH|nr:LAMI_0F08790g1_1 [Lachancea mirantina]